MFGPEFRAARVALHLSQHECAQYLGLADRTVQRMDRLPMEAGEVPGPVAKLMELALAADVEPIVDANMLKAGQDVLHPAAIDGAHHDTVRSIYLAMWRASRVSAVK